MKHKVLIVDDEATFRQMVVQILRGEGYDCTAVCDAAEARRTLEQERFVLILCDINLPGESGLDFVHFSLREYPGTAVIMVTGFRDREMAADALSMGAYGVLIKPFEKIQLLIAMDNALRRLDVENEMEQHIASLDRLVQERTCDLQEKVLELEKSGEQLQAVMENIPVGIAVIDQDTRSIVNVNRAMEVILARPREEIVGRVCNGIFCRDKAEICTSLDAGASVTHREINMPQPGGKEILVIQKVVPMTFMGKDHWMDILIDITEQRQATQQYIRENREKKQLMEAIPSILIGVSGDDSVIHWNLASQKTFGIHAAAVVEKQFQDCGISWDWKKLEKGIFFCRKHHRQVRVENLSFAKPGGKRGFLGITLAPIAPDSGGQNGFIIIAEDITDLIQARKNLLTSEERHRTLFESSRDAIFTLGPPSWKFTSCNKATLELFDAGNKSQLMALTPWDVSPAYQPGGLTSADVMIRQINLAIAEGSVFFEYTHSCISGETFPATVLLTRLELAGNLMVQGTVRNISQQKSLEIQLSQARKLEAVGQLASGIAHEINTPIQYVGDNHDFLKDSFGALLDLLDSYERVKEEIASENKYGQLVDAVEAAVESADLDYLREEIPESMAQTREGINRISEIVRSMKEFSHPGIKEKTAMDINRAIKNTLTVSRNEWKYLVEMETDLAPNLPLVPCLPGELNQVFLNIIINAAQAIGEEALKDAGKKGKIQIQTAEKKDAVQIKISDTGPGIPQDIQTRIFDPFFTTKAVGKGTGQGLAISRSIVVEKHGGSLNFETSMGKGTTFVIELPINNEVIP